MDKDKSFQDLLQDSLKELQESKELKGEQHEQSNTAAPLFTFTDTIRAGIEEYNRHNRSKREQSQSLSQDRGNDSTSYHGSTLAILNQRKARGRAESRTSRAESRESEDIKAKSGAIKATSRIVQEIYSTQNRLSQTERREFSEILRETEIFKQQALHTYTDIQHNQELQNSQENIQESLTYTSQDSKENTPQDIDNQSHKEHTEYLHSQLTILKEHTQICKTTLSPTQKEQSHKKIIKALENIENLIESSNTDSKVLQNKNTQAQNKAQIPHHKMIQRISTKILTLL